MTIAAQKHQPAINKKNRLFFFFLFLGGKEPHWNERTGQKLLKTENLLNEENNIYLPGKERQQNLRELGFLQGP